MNPEQIEAEYRRLVELDRKRTPGGWVNENGSISSDDGCAIGSAFTADEFPCLDEEDTNFPQAVAECEANGNFIASAPAMMRLLQAMRAEMGRMREDAERLDAIQVEIWKVEPFEIRMNDDADVGWQVIQFTSKGEVVMATEHSDNVRKAIDTARRVAP